MGLLLSILVVCVGVLEAVSCFRHIQHGYLPFWMPRRRPTLHERRRRKPSDGSSSSDEELSRLMTNDVMLSSTRAEPHYGLTPILAEHRRNTPILRDEEDAGGDGEEVAVDKYVANNIDDCLVNSCDGSKSSEVIERFRPISPTDTRQDGASGTSDALGQTRDVAETDERCDSEVTLSGDVDEDLDVVSAVKPPAVDALLESLELVEPLESIATVEPVTVDALFAETKPATIEEATATQETNDDTPATRETNETTSQVDSVTTTEHTDPGKRPDPAPPKPLDLHPALDGPLSRPSTPSTPRKVRADISWPVFHPDEPVIKRPCTELGKALRLSLSHDDSIDEDLLDAELEGIELETVTQSKGKDKADLLDAKLQEIAPEIVTQSQERDVEDHVDTSLPERIEPQIKPTLDMFLESLDRLDSSLEAKDVGDDVERVEVDFEADDVSDANTPGQRPDFDMLLDGLDAMEDVSPKPPLASDDDINMKQQNSEPFHLDSLLTSTSSHIPTLPEIPARPASPKVSTLDFDIQIIDDHFSKVVVEDPIELSTPFVDIQAIPRSHSTTRTQDYETPRGRAMVDGFGRIVGVETDEEVARRIEAMIVPRDVETPRNVERAFDKKVASDTERLVSLKDIFEPECKKVTAFCVADVQGAFADKPSEDDEIITKQAIEEDLCEIKNDAFTKLDTAGTQDTAGTPCSLEYLQESIEAAELVDAPVFETEISATHITKSDDLQSPPSPVTLGDLDQSNDITKSLEDVVAQETDAILETIANVDKQTNENASEFEPSVAVATHPNDDAESLATLASETCIGTTTLPTDGNAAKILESLPISVTQPLTTDPSLRVDATPLATQPSIEVDKVDDDDMREVSESLALGKDITSKESSIKRRKSYKKRSPRTSTESLTGDDHTQSKERRRELTASREETMLEEDAVNGSHEAEKSRATQLGDTLQGSPPVKSGKLMELSPKEEVKLEYSSPEVKEDLATAKDTKMETLSLQDDSASSFYQRTLAKTDEGNRIQDLEEKPTNSEELLPASTPKEVGNVEETPAKREVKSLELSLENSYALQYPSSEGATALATSTPNEDSSISKTIVKLTELSPSEEVQLAYTSPDDDIPARDESPSPPPPTHRRESAAEAISNNALLPVEVLHVDVGAVKEAAVFATTTKEQGKKLKRPARAESFEEAVVDVRIQGRMPTREQEGKTEVKAAKDGEDGDVETSTEQKNQERSKKSVGTGEVRSSGENVDGGAVKDDGLEVDDRKCTDPVVVAGSGGSAIIETNPNVDERKEAAEEDEEEEESVSAAGDVKHPTQASNPAFWLIFSGEYTKAMSKDWHSGHFCCWQCDESLTGQRYVLRDDHPYCIKCYESVFANMCEECSKTIGIDSKDLSYKDKHWHEACFLCNKCRVSLVDKQFGSKADKIYCGNCYDSQFASRCDGCGEIFRAGTKKMEYKTRQWHEKCFCCCVCKSAIGTKSFIPREQEIYCATCYEEKFATRCVKCNKIITSGGVTYKNEPWHRECFTCTHCSASLAGQRFTSRDEKPYCADCFGELFAKRCTACVKPITGIGGTRFISFEDRHWHNDCFICASCKTSLVGRGFITDADDIICPECAKQKLM